MAKGSEEVELLREMLDVMRQQQAAPPTGSAGAHFAGARFRRGPQDRLGVGIAIGALLGVIGLLLVTAPDDDPPQVAADAAALSQPTGSASVGTDVSTSGAAATPMTAAPSTSDTAPIAPSSGGSTSGGAASGPPPTPAASAAAAPAGPPARGVTATKIKIGIGIPDKSLDGLIGDSKGYYDAILDEWRRTKQVPVHGRDVEFVYHRWDLTPAGQRASCVNLAQDNKVFAGMGWGFSIGAECMAKEYKMPVVSGVGSVEDTMIRRGWPYLFWTNMSTERVLRNWPHWAHDGGWLAGKKIGLYYNSTPQAKAAIDGQFKPQLAKLGYQIAAEATQGEQGSEVLAVQRFKAAGVNVVFLMTNPGGFTQAAQTQAYKPQYLMSDYDNSGYTADGVPATQGYIPQQLDGAFAMTYYRRAENGTRGNPPTPPVGTECVNNYARFSGQRPYSKTDPAESIKWDSMQHTCDQGRIMIKALQAAGPALNEMALVRAMETTIRLQASGELADLTFGPQKHTGADLLKTIKFTASCICWDTAKGFHPVWVP